MELIQPDICGPIHPPFGPFRYFMVLKDASASWSHACLLSTSNLAFVRLAYSNNSNTRTISDYAIKIICLHNTDEFTSQIFDDYCMLIGTTI